MRGTASCEPASVDATKARNQNNQTAKWQEGSAKVACRGDSKLPSWRLSAPSPLIDGTYALQRTHARNRVVPHFWGRGGCIENPARGWLEVLLRGMMPVIGEAPVYAASRKTIPLDGGHGSSRPPATIVLGLVSRQAGAPAL